jgi:hypothetical protein
MRVRRLRAARRWDNLQTSPQYRGELFSRNGRTKARLNIFFSDTRNGGGNEAPQGTRSAGRHVLPQRGDHRRVRDDCDALTLLTLLTELRLRRKTKQVVTFVTPTCRRLL